MEQNEKRKHFEVFITLTFSKIMAFLVLLAATIVTYKTKDPTVFNNSLYVIGLLVVGRQAANAIKTPKQ